MAKKIVHICKLCKLFDHKTHTWKRVGKSCFFYCCCGAVAEDNS